MPKYGDIVIYKEHHLFVSKVWENHSNCWLVHPYVEYTSKNDFIIETQDSGLSYVLVVQTSMYVNVFNDKMWHVCNTNVDDEQVKLALNNNGVGTHVWGAIAEFKNSQIETCSKLTQDCTSYLLDR